MVICVRERHRATRSPTTWWPCLSTPHPAGEQVLAPRPRFLAHPACPPPGTAWPGSPGTTRTCRGITPISTRRPSPGAGGLATPGGRAARASRSPSPGGHRMGGCTTSPIAAVGGTSTPRPTPDGSDHRRPRRRDRRPRFAGAGLGIRTVHLRVPGRRPAGGDVVRRRTGAPGRARRRRSCSPWTFPSPRMRPWPRSTASGGHRRLAGPRRRRWSGSASTAARFRRAGRSRERRPRRRVPLASRSR